KKLLNMLKELKDAEDIYNNVFYYRNFSIDNITRNAVVKSKFRELDSLTHLPTKGTKEIIPIAIEFRRLIKNELDVFYFDDKNNYGKRWDDTFNSATSNQELQRYIDALYSDYNDTYMRERDK